jgi:glycosyltransferase involved in cell wall biosynthesis
MMLRIAGKEIDRQYAAKLYRHVAALGLSRAVAFIGRRTTAELVELYRGCAVFTFPSSIESFGMPLAEAMACGAPIVASSTSAIPEIVGDAALLCDPSDSRDIAHKILRVLDDPGLRRSLCERSLMRAKEFSWAGSARQTANVLRNAMANHPGRAASVQSSLH